MFLHHLTINQNIVEVYHDEFVQKSAENVIYEGTKCGWCIGQPKRHNGEFVRPTTRDTCRLQFFPRLDPHLVVSASQVHLRKDPCVVELVEELVSIRYVIFVLHHDLV